MFDTITAPFRRLFHEEQEEVNEQGEVETYIIIKGEGLRSWIGELLSCYWCRHVVHCCLTSDIHTFSCHQHVA